MREQERLDRIQEVLDQADESLAKLAYLIEKLPPDTPLDKKATYGFVFEARRYLKLIQTLLNEARVLAA
jgi:hypothetical protein